MDDLISRQAAIDELNLSAELLRRVLDDADIVGAEREKYEWGLGLIESSISDIKEFPTADVVEVKRGKWVTMSDADGVYWACSECGEDIPRVSHYDPQFDLFPRLESIEKTNFCPNCGAYMREETDE